MTTPVGNVLLLITSPFLWACIPKGAETCRQVGSGVLTSSEPIALEWDGKVEPTLQVAVHGQGSRDDDAEVWDTSSVLSLVVFEASGEDLSQSYWSIPTSTSGDDTSVAPNRINLERICGPVDAKFTFEVRDGVLPDTGTPPEPLYYNIFSSWGGPYEIELWNGWMLNLELFSSLG